MPPPLAVLLEQWRRRPTVPGRLVVPPGLRAFFLAGLAADRPVLAIVPGEREAEELAEDAALFVEALHLPAWETLPFEHVSPSVQAMGARAVARPPPAPRAPGLGAGSGRAGIVDVYPAQGPGPRRVDFWGDEVEEVRAFSVADQRSTDRLEELIVFPAREVRADPGVRAAAAALAGRGPWGASTWARPAGGGTV